MRSPRSRKVPVSSFRASDRCESVHTETLPLCNPAACGGPPGSAASGMSPLPCSHATPPLWGRTLCPHGVNGPTPPSARVGSPQTRVRTVARPQRDAGWILVLELERPRRTVADVNAPGRPTDPRRAPSVAKPLCFAVCVLFRASCSIAFDGARSPRAENHPRPGPKTGPGTARQEERQLFRPSDISDRGGTESRLPLG